ncbi:hypothetical protein Plo01_36670 [Planobispora longispora]|uniref:Ig-like domain-containing protein n=2 Tax=Planobispora longispora TaxID=28887 RepID=A0A8J3W669_9ACTN|nr:hypothetical protein Plo01_36670 [Planobispora longispora]
MLATMATGLLASPAAAATGSTQGKTTSSTYTKPKAKPAVFAGTPKVSFSAGRGECPVRVTFSSKIKVKAVKGKTTVAYRWLRGDGSKSKIKTFTVGKGVKHVTVKESAVFKKDLKGWQALQVLTPRKATSGKAYFKVSCDDWDGGWDGGHGHHWYADADAWVDEGNCKAVLIGRISVSSPRWVHYRWVVNGRVIASDSVKVYDSRRVTHVIRTDKSLHGWAQLQLVGPRHGDSNRVGFKIWCKDWSPKATASVSAPGAYDGSCPVDRTFLGEIRVSYGHRGHVKYRWIRNGVPGAWETVYVSGTRTVSDTWRASESGTATRAIELYHGSTTGTVTGKVTCTAPVNVTLSNVTAVHTAAGCPKGALNLSGTITATGATTVSYVWTVNGNEVKKGQITFGAGGGSEQVPFSAESNGLKNGTATLTVGGKSQSANYDAVCVSAQGDNEAGA